MFQIKNNFKLAASILLCLSAGTAGSFFTATSVDTWYRAINKPVFTPPGYIFGPVWTLLYILMGISFYLLWRKGFDKRHSKRALWVFMVQLLLNPVWSFAFFGARSPLAGLIVIALLWAAIILTMAGFFRVSRIASILLIPYFLWVSFASILNGAIFLLNR